MPYSPKRPCPHPGCSALTDGGRCPAHQRERQQQHNQARGSSTQQGYGSKWRRERLRFLDENPLCVECKAAGRVTAATDVDHIVPHSGDRELFWRRSNWQALCGEHHRRKTIRENGGFKHQAREGEGVPRKSGAPLQGSTAGAARVRSQNQRPEIGIGERR